MESKELIILVKEMIVELKAINTKLDFIGINGLLVKYDDEINEN